MKRRRSVETSASVRYGHWAMLEAIRGRPWYRVWDYAVVSVQFA